MQFPIGSLYEPTLHFVVSAGMHSTVEKSKLDRNGNTGPHVDDAAQTSFNSELSDTLAACHQLTGQSTYLQQRGRVSASVDILSVGMKWTNFICILL